MNKRSILSYGTGVFLLFVGIGAVAGGLGLMLEPDGSGVHLPLELLKNTPFYDYSIPGAVLFGVNGIGSLIVAAYAFRNSDYAGQATILLGVFMIIWISAQVYWIGWCSWLQPTYFIAGVVEMGLGVSLNEKHAKNHGMFGSHHGFHTH